MQKVLVTGADGFIGSHLTEELVRRGYNVKAFVLYNSFNSWGWLDSLDKSVLGKIEIIAGDVRDFESVKKAITDVSIIFHLAALISIPYSYVSPESFFETNTKGTLNILQASRYFKKIDRILITSTSEVYGTAKYAPIDENHPLQAQSPYSASKIGADKIAESFYRSFGLPISIVRPFNTYGPRQSARAIIPTIITQLLIGAKEIRLGNTTPTRDLNFVEDVCRGFIEIASEPKTIGEEINIGTGTEISIGELAAKIINMINPSVKIEFDETRIRPINSEVERLIADNTKIKNLTNWKSLVSLDSGLEITVEWMRKNLEKYKPGLYNI